MEDWRGSLRRRAEDVVADSSSSSGSGDEEHTNDGGSDGEGGTPQPEPHAQCLLRLAISACTSKALKELLTAHADLDDLLQQPQSFAQASTWQDMHALLKRSVPMANADLVKDVERQMRKTHGVFNLGDVSILARSIDRLHARLDVVFSDKLSRSITSSAYTTTLSSLERRALNACMQIWRKCFRGISDSFDGPATSRMDTCLETSALCMTRTLVVCTNGQAGRLEGVRTACAGYTSLQVCCTSVAQWKEILTDLLPLGAPSDIVHLAVRPHCPKSNDPPFYISSVPPCLIDKQIATFDGVQFRASSVTPGVAPESLVNVMERTNERASPAGWRPASSEAISTGPAVMLDAPAILAKLKKHFDRHAPPADVSLSSLMASCILVLRRHCNALTSDALPPHLHAMMADAYRCASCRRIILSPTCVCTSSLSTQFQHAARSAGFDTRPDWMKLFSASLREHSLWTPPFREVFTRSCKGIVVAMVVAGYHANEEPRSDAVCNTDEDLTWRFCAPCAAAHIAQTELYGRQCRCIVCVRERQDRRGIEESSVWSRH